MCKDICKFILLVLYVNDLVQEIIQDDLDILTDNVNLAFCYMLMTLCWILRRRVIYKPC